MMFSLDDFDAMFLAKLRGETPVVEERVTRKIKNSKERKKEEKEVKPKEVMESPVAIGLVASVLETSCKCGQTSQVFQKEYVRYSYKGRFENKAITEATKIEAEKMRLHGSKFLLKRKVAVEFCEYCSTTALECYADAEVIEV